jgi:acetyl-CoA carboxylase biotin carboxyl carrier protein
MTDAGDPIVEAIDRLAPALERDGLDEIEVEIGELHLRLVRPRTATAAQTATGASSPAVDVPASAATQGGGDGLTPFGAPAPGMRFVSAPLTGVWYPAPSPGARPYVNEGDEITAGQVVGLIEAMKLFNEIKCDASGRITRVLVENGTLVKRKQPLLEIDPR